MMNREKRQLPKKSEDLSEWYNRVVMLSELADYGPAKGTMIFRPYGYGIWELIQKEMDVLIKATGVENAYFPMLIPESLLKREKEHVEGFSPELAVVTIGGGEELKEKLIVRPTSETIMYDAYSKWVQSWRDLPILINQWNNCVRWEKRTYLFLRTSEFLWQEGHTAHATHEEAIQMQKTAMEIYEKTYRDFFAIPGIVGYKSDAERFAGAASSITYETLMPEGKSVQSCTSHDLGQNFSKVFNIKFQDKTGKTEYAWQTSWGFSTRSIGALIMAHGDDAGLVLPPRLAPIQVVILPITHDKKEMELCFDIVARMEEAGVRVKIDDREDESIGYRINKWELKGVPVRIEIGKREEESKNLTVVRRDTGEKMQMHNDKLQTEIPELLKKIQNNLIAKQEEFLKANTHVVENYSDFKNIMENTRGFISAFWCGEAECEAAIKEETKATTRCLPLDAKDEKAVCVRCGKSAKNRWMFGLAY
jgi:prolyl-tRNA synthetase